jgi:hypothetical protein
MPRTLPTVDFLSSPTQCFAVKVVFADGTTVGYTDASQSFVYGDLTYTPSDSIDVSHIVQELGTDTPSVEVEGLADGSITRRAMLTVGSYQDCRLFVYLIDFLYPDHGAMILQQFRIAKTQLGDTLYKLEAQGLLSFLSTQNIGKVVTANCTVTRFGNVVCDPGQTIRAARTFSRAVCYVLSPWVTDFAADTNPSDYYSLGDATWTSGDNNGLIWDIKLHGKITPATWSSSTTYALGDYAIGSDTHVYISLEAANLNHNPASTSGHWAAVTGDPAHIARITWKPNNGYPVTVGDTAGLCFGCDRTATTCSTVDNADNSSGVNIENYQGFWGLPNPDQIRVIGKTG